MPMFTLVCMRSSSSTEPGDLIAFDDHLTHSSFGGAVRRQWRIDFGADPANEVEESLVRADYARILDGSWDLGDDVERYPSFGPYWRSLDRPWTTRLGDLGVYELADRYHAARLSRPVARWPPYPDGSEDEGVEQ